MTEDELLEHLDCPEVEYKDDGTVWIYYHNQALEINDNFNDDGIFYMLRKDNSKSMYITIKYNNDYARSPSAYVQPWEFNTSD